MPSKPLAYSAEPGSHAGDPQLELNDIQGDILVGLQKNAEAFLFFQITDVHGFRRTVRESLAARVTSAQTALLREFQIREQRLSGQDHKLPLSGLNIGFTHRGLAKLVEDTSGLDPSFVAGAAKQAGALADPVDRQGRPSSWLRAFDHDAIDGVLLVTGPDATFVGGKVRKLRKQIAGSADVIHGETGQVRPQRGHEHFGFLDGVSQPGIRGLTARLNPLDDEQGLPGQDLIWPGMFVFGYPGQDTGDRHAPGPVRDGPHPWMRNGSYMVFRRLRQRVPEFHAFVAQEASRLGMDPDLLGARLVGRWKSGAPVSLAPLQDDAALGGDALRNNDFAFATDPGQRRCPFAAHIRKTYPRDDLDEADTQQRRIRRAGIPFGPEVEEDEDAQRGLMFVCYQTSIVDQFEFVQKLWANNTAFVFGKTRPDGSAAAVVPGHDPIIGQEAARGRERVMDEPVPNYPFGNTRSEARLPDDFVVPTAAAYVFVPSLSALRDVIGA
jgi:Dyp-type peroxidase family